MTIRARLRKSGILILLGFTLAAAAPALATTQAYWFESYQRAVSLINAGRAEEATGMLDELIREHPTPANAVRIAGSQFIDYLPYYQQARAHAQLGDLATASDHLATAETYGEVHRSRRHLRTLAELKESLETSRTARR